MNLEKVNIKILVKYIILAGIIYYILHNIPKNKFSDKEKIVIIPIILVSFYTLEYFLKPVEKMTNTDDINVNNLDLEIENKWETQQNKQLKNKLSSSNTTSSLNTSNTSSYPNTSSSYQNTSYPNTESYPNTTSSNSNYTVDKNNSDFLNGNTKDSINININNNIDDILKQLKKFGLDDDDLINKVKESAENKKSKNMEQDESDENFVVKYLKQLMQELYRKKIIDKTDINNIEAKLKTKLVSPREMVKILENLKNTTKEKNLSTTDKINLPSSDPNDLHNDSKYSNLPDYDYNPLGDKIANDWDNQYTVLNTDRWQVPQTRPPVCISNEPCKVCPSVNQGYELNLDNWNNGKSNFGNKPIEVHS